jgi:hypothetical protein
MKLITGAQMRAARALLRWSADDLAKHAKLGVATVRRAEATDGPPSITEANGEAVRTALEKAGVEFIAENGGGAGVRIRKSTKGAEEISRQIDALEDKISSMPAPMKPSPESAMNIMRKAVAKSDLTKLKNRRTRLRNDRR